MIVLKRTDKKINSVIHIADIHIRLTKRHDEYTLVFEKLYKALDKAKTLDAILVIAGDLFHNKSDLSPECVKLGSDFLKSCADRVPVILTAGNHDATLANKSRLDCITPIVDALNHPNLYYLKKTDIYRYENILFNNLSVFDWDAPEKYIKYTDIPTKYRDETDHHIALFHGPVYNAVTDIGYTVNNRSVTNETFNGHHIAMLGDIHKHQMLQEYNEDESLPVIVYAGSMIQQNHGEDLKGHGFLMWDLKRKVYKHYELKNDYGFYTVEVDKGKLITDISDIPKKVTLRIICRESIPSQVKEVVNDLKNKSTLIETTYVRADDALNDINLNSGKSFDIHNIFDVDYQNKLIENNLISKNIDKSVIEMVKDLNKTINKEVPKDKAPKNIRWKPKKFEFDNMFSYGEGNVIDFAKLNGTIGLFAPNASGKSSIMDALAFCIFDKFSKGYKAVHVLNTQKMSFRCKFNFEVNGIDYFIQREGKADKKGNVKVEVKFYKMENGNESPLNGEARRSTNDIIRDYVGTYEDFILTVLSIQNSKVGSFIDLGQTERKDLLCQFMGLDVFDQLYTIANDKFKETNILLKNISKDQLIQELEVVSGSIDYNNTKITECNEEIKKQELLKESHNNMLLELSNNITKTVSFDFNISDLESDKIKIESQIEQTNVNVKNQKDKLKDIDVKISALSFSLSNCENIDQDYDRYKQVKQNFDNKTNELNNLKIVVKNKMDKLKKLEDHKYDPNCSYCVNNVFVKDAIKVKAELDNDKSKAKIIFDEYNALKLDLDGCGDVESKFKECQKINLEKVNFDKTRSIISNTILKLENDLIKIQATVKSVTDNINIFYTNKDIIENNNTTLKEIGVQKDIIKNLDTNIKSINSKLFSSSTEKGRLELQYKNVTDQLQKVKDLESSYESFKHYTTVVSRDGIPYEIITKTLPEIEKEVNNILQQLVEFTITLQTDGKNIMTNIVYDDRQWPLEMASGMEKFVSGLAIRVALINISNLPRPNIICIDEGFGCADSDHLGQMGALFNYLKHQFDFIWVISHLDQMRDMVDSQIEIKKDNGFSKVVCI